MDHREYERPTYFHCPLHIDINYCLQTLNMWKDCNYRILIKIFKYAKWYVKIFIPGLPWRSAILPIWKLLCHSESFSLHYCSIPDRFAWFLVRSKRLYTCRFCEINSSHSLLSGNISYRHSSFMVRSLIFGVRKRLYVADSRISSVGFGHSFIFIGTGCKYDLSAWVGAMRE